MAPLTDFITTVVNAFTPLIVPIGLLACVMGVILVMVGYNHGANFLRTSILVTITAFAATVIGPNLGSLIKWPPWPATFRRPATLMNRSASGA